MPPLTMLINHLPFQSSLICVRALKRHQYPSEPKGLIQSFRLLRCLKQCHLGLWVGLAASLLTLEFIPRGVHSLRRKPASSDASHLIGFEVIIQPK